MTSADAHDFDEDADDFADELQAQGADPDAVARWREQFGAEDDGAEEEAVELWPENAEAFRVFQHCKWERQIVAGLDRTLTVYGGIAAAEIRSVCALLGVPAERSAQVLSLVRVAESVALPILNSRN